MHDRGIVGEEAGGGGMRARQGPGRRGLRWFTLIRDSLLPKRGNKIWHLTFGIGAAYAIGMLSSPILSRLFSPDDFGQLTIFSALVGVLLPIAGGRFDLAIPVSREASETKSLVILSCMVGVGFTAVLTLCGAAYFFLVGAFPFGLSPLVAAAVPLALLAALAMQLMTEVAIRNNSLSSLARSKVTQAAGQVALQVGAGFAQLSAVGLVLGEVGGRLLAAARLRAAEYSVLMGATLRRAALWETAKRYRHFPLVSTWSGILNAASAPVPPLALVTLYGLTVAGYFGLMLRAVSAPLTIVGRAVADAYSGRVAQAARERDVVLTPLLKRTVLRLAVLGLFPLIVLLLYAPGMFSLVFGPEWLEAGDYARLVAISVYSNFIVDPISRTLRILEAHGAQIGWDAGRLILISIPFLAAGLFGLDASTTLLWWAVAGVVADAVLLGVIVVRVGRFDRDVRAARPAP